MAKLFDDLVLALSEDTKKTTETCLELWKDLLSLYCTWKTSICVFVISTAGSFLDVAAQKTAG